ncbi:MAG: nucleoside-diphosphate sugar epimerase/dehydratase [Rhodospirillales bacterium]
MLFRIPRRGFIVYGHDIVMAAASFVLSLYLRLGDSFYFYSPDLLVQGTILFTLISASVFWIMGLYRGVWRYASLNDLLAIAKAATLAVLVFMLVMFLWIRLEEFPRSTLVINWFVLMALLGGPRFLYRLFKDRRIDLHYEDESRPIVPVLLVGAGDGAELFIRAISRAPEANYRVVGIVAENKSRVGRHIHGVEVMGTINDISSIVAALDGGGEKPQRLILTKDDMGGTVVRTLLDEAYGLGITLARLPRLTDFKSGVSEQIEVKPVALEDLLGRPQTALDRDSMQALIEGKRVLVTGAGGSIGSELVRQIADLKPSEMALLDNSEYNLYQIDMEVGATSPALARRAMIGDVRDRRRIEGVFEDFKPQLVFHAAALKHVPMVEANIAEGMTTNVLGSVNVADACKASKVAAMVLISTDKAVNPTSVMGATKRIAEGYCQALDREHGGSSTRFITVRVGNVLGSTGSVVPLFQKQLSQGGPLTVTHPEMSRYFMTVREAVELVLQASALGCGAPEHEGSIFVLDMGKPVKILDLAKQIIRLAGLKPQVDIEIKFIGQRPGEKLFEEMFHSSEPLKPTECPGILLAEPRGGDAGDLIHAFKELAKAGAEDDIDTILGIMHRLVPEYRSSEAPSPKAASG